MLADIWPYAAALIPTIVVAYMFYRLMKAILEGDRRERAAQAKWESEQDRLREAAPAKHRPHPESN